MDAIRPALSRQLQLEDLRRSLGKMQQAELRQCCEHLAELALVTQPAVIRWLTEDAAKAWQAVMRSEAAPGELPPGVEPWHEQLANELLGQGSDHHS